MKYDFETVYNSPDRSSEKWNAARALGCPVDIVPLSVADMEFKTAPEIIEAVKEMAAFGLWGYADGDTRLKKAVTSWMWERHGWEAKEEWIVHTPGIVPGIYTAVRAFTEPGDRVLIQPPVYPPFFSSVEKNGRILLENTLKIVDEQYEIDFDDLREKASLAKMMIFCNPHNPVGRVWSKEDVLQIAEICYENNVLLFSDEIHCDIVFKPHRHIAYGTLPHKYQSNCIIGTAASKTFSLAGLSTSSLLIPDEGLKRRFVQQMQRDCLHFNSTFGVVAATAAYEKGASWLDALLEVIHDNYLYIKKKIETDMPMFKVYPLEGTYLAWMDCSALKLKPKGLDEFMQKEASLYANSGASFGKSGNGFIRLNLACPKKVLEGAMERLEKAIVDSQIEKYG